MKPNERKNEAKCDAILPGDAMLAQYMQSSCVRQSVRHKPVLCRNDWTNRAGFWHGGFVPPIPNCVIRICGYLQELGYFPLGLCPKLRT